MTPELEALAAEVEDLLAEGEIPPNTRRTYTAQWEKFSHWCQVNSVAFLPTTEEVVTLYLLAKSKDGAKMNTLSVALAAITWIHRKKGIELTTASMPKVQAVMRELRKRKKERVKKKRAFLLDDLKRGLPEGQGKMAVRGRAVLLFGFFTAMRRSEIAALTLDDLELLDGGYKVHIASSKTDQDAHGQEVFLPKLDDEACPVKALEQWLEVRGKEQGSLFGMKAATVGQLVKAAAKRAGFDPEEFGGHSLRSGFATSAAKAGADNRATMKVTRHRSEKVFLGYVQDGTFGDDHPGKALVCNLKR